MLASPVGEVPLKSKDWGFNPAFRERGCDKQNHECDEYFEHVQDFPMSAYPRTPKQKVSGRIT
jgi:hypothetical protein